MSPLAWRRGLKLAVMILVLLPASVWPWPGKVIGISDGDTLTALRDGRDQVKVRLYGIDAPEMGQPYGDAAKWALSGMAFGQVVEIQDTDRDKYGRTVAHVLVSGLDVSERLVQAGLAWVYLDYCKEPACSGWIKAQAEARAAKAGLWADADPTPPWKYRHPATEKKAAAEIVYHGNVSSRIFHRPGCRYYWCKNCVAEFRTRDEAIKAGYRPCKVCRP